MKNIINKKVFTAYNPLKEKLKIGGKVSDLVEIIKIKEYFTKEKVKFQHNCYTKGNYIIKISLPEYIIIMDKIKKKENVKKIKKIGRAFN